MDEHKRRTDRPGVNIPALRKKADSIMRALMKTKLGAYEYMLMVFLCHEIFDLKAAHELGECVVVSKERIVRETAIKGRRHVDRTIKSLIDKNIVYQKARKILCLRPAEDWKCTP
jgi:hypothetical protein